MMLANASIEIAARPDEVFEMFTTEAGLRRWMAREASVDLRPGGAWRWTFENGDASAGEFLEIEPPDRLVFTYGWESGPFADVGPGTTRVDVTFEQVDGGTLVTVDHAGLPVTHVERHAAGWRYFIGVLADVCAGQPAPPVNLPPTDGPTTDRPPTDRQHVDRQQGA